MQEKKVMLGSAEWIELGGEILTDIVKEYGEDGFALSVCEVFVEAPAEIADKQGNASWCFYVDGKSVRSSPGASKEVDLYMQATWELELPGARQVYTPEWLAEQETNPTPRPEDPNMVIEGDMNRLPAWIMEFHNRLAVRTA
jgi:hypothetical protein